MAWAEKLPSGKYRGCYRDATGKKHTVKEGPFTQKAEAKRKAAAKEDEQRQLGAITADAGKIPWGAWWAQLIESHPVDEHSERKYRTAARLHILPYFKDTPLEDMDLMAGHRWLKVLQAGEGKLLQVKADWEDPGPRSPWVIRSAAQVLMMSMNAATPPHARRLPVNPLKGLQPPDLPDSPERFLTAEEVARLTHFMNDSYRLITWVAANTGLRMGELGGLHTSRVDLDRGVITVMEQFDEYTGTVKPCPKDKEKRHVPVPDETLALLRKHIETLPRQESCGTPHKVGRCPGGPLVFAGANSGPFRGCTYNVRVLKRAQRLAGIEGRLRPHDLRHTYASWLIQEGVSLAEVARMMGHSDTEVTKRYAHLAQDGYEKVREALSRRGAPRGADLSVVKTHEGSWAAADRAS